MKELLFVYPKKASFIDLDIDLLSSEFKIHQNYYSWDKKNFIPFFIIHQFFFILFKAKKFHASSVAGLRESRIAPAYNTSKAYQKIIWRGWLQKQKIQFTLRILDLDLLIKIWLKAKVNFG